MSKQDDYQKLVVYEQYAEATFEFHLTLEVAI